ncbi:MAG: RHS repeat-associated core domain-containing protein [Chloroflexota bacterium]
MILSVGFRPFTTKTPEYDSLGRVAGTIANSVSVTALSSCSFDPNRTDSDEDLCTTNTYDAVGNLTVTKDPAGRETHMFYDELNRMEGQVVNATGTIASINDFGTCFTLAADRDTNLCTQYEFDEVGNTTITTDPSGRQTRTFYDALNRVEATVMNWDGTITAANQCVYGSANVSYSQNIDTNICSKPGYDSVTGRQVSSTNALGQTSLTVYDEIGRPFISVANWDGTTTITSEADCSFPPAEADTNLCSVTYFDDLGRRSGTKDPMGNETDFDYDDLGRMTTTTRYLQTSGGTVNVVNTAGFDGLGNRKTSTNPDGYTVTSAYDGLNRVTSTTTHEGVVSTQEYNALGWVNRSLDGLNHATVPGYDGLGRTVSTTNAESNVSQMIYDVLGNQVGMIDANSIRTSYLYDDLNRLSHVIENDTAPLNQPTTQQTGQADENNVTTFEYNVRGSQVEIMNARGFTVTVTTFDDLERPIAVTNALGDADSTIYDALGNVRQMTDRNGEVVTYQYDGLNRPTSITYQSDGETVEFEYDAIGNRKVMTDAVGTTTYAHDSLYRITSVTDPFTQTVGYEYDLRGNRTKLIYPDNREVVYTYDGDSRLEKVTDWNSAETVYGYDAASRLITTTLPNGVMATNVYDDANRLEKLTYTDTSSNLIAEFDYQLDAVGNRVSVTETLKNPAAMAQIQFALEQAEALILEAEGGNDLALVQGPAEQPVQENSSTNILWNVPDPWGRMPAATSLASIQYPVAASPANMTNALPTTVSSVGQWPGLELGYGLKSAAVEAQSETASFNDSASELSAAGTQLDPALGASATTSTVTTTHTVHVVSYTYDDLYRLTDAVYTGNITATYAYEYDEVGNMQAYTDTVDAVTATHTRVFNAMNQMTSETQVEVGTKTITYDDNGNMVRIDPVSGSGSPVKLYTFNQRGMMTKAEELGASLQTVAEFRYDGNNDRLEQVEFTGGTASKTIQYTNDTIGLTQMLVSDGGAGNVVYRLYGNTHLGQQTQGSSQFQTFIPDGLGSVRVEMETSGATNYVRTFSPFGETLDETGTSGSVYGYTGQQEDTSTGLIYLRARYYSAELKAFTAYDAWDGVNMRPKTLNHYSYVEGNPANLIDPSGNIAICFEGGINNNNNPITEWDTPEDYTLNGISHWCGLGLESGGYDTNIHGKIYYLRNGDSSVASAQHLVEEELRKNPNQPVIIMGYSWGGAAAVDLTQKFHPISLPWNGFYQEAIEVDLLFLVEPEFEGRGEEWNYFEQIIDSYNYGEWINTDSFYPSSPTIPPWVLEAVNIDIDDRQQTGIGESNGTALIDNCRTITLTSIPDRSNSSPENNVEFEHYPNLVEPIGVVNEPRDFVVNQLRYETYRALERHNRRN